MNERKMIDDHGLKDTYCCACCIHGTWGEPAHDHELDCEYIDDEMVKPYQICRLFEDRM